MVKRKTKLKLSKVVKTTTGNIYLLFILILMLFLLTYIALSILNSQTINKEFISFVTSISFTLMGFTFLGSILTKDKGSLSWIEYDIFTSCMTFILSSLSFFAYLALEYLPPYNMQGNPLTGYNFLMGLKPYLLFIGSIFLITGLFWIFSAIVIRMKEINDIAKKNHLGWWWKMFNKKDFFGLE